MPYYDLAGDVDVLGDAEILGDELLGFNFGRAANLALNPVAQFNAVRGAMRGGAGAARARAAASGQRAAVQQNSQYETRRLLMGIDSVTTVAAAATSTITVNPVEPFRPEALIVDTVVAQNFLITQILIGRKSQLVGTASIPASAFVAPGSAVGILQWDTAQTAQPLQITVNNTSGGASRFTAVMVGTAVG